MYLLEFKGLLSGTLFSMLVVFSLIVNSQYHTATGELKLSTMSTSIKGCSHENFTQVSQTWVCDFGTQSCRINSIHRLFNFRSETILFTDADEEFDIHDISMHWYTLIGVICVWIPGVIISYMTGGRDLSTFNFQLISKWMRRWIPKKYLHTKLKVISIINDD